MSARAVLAEHELSALPGIFVEVFKEVHARKEAA
jgi:hypothetical protein